MLSLKVATTWTPHPTTEWSSRFHLQRRLMLQAKSISPSSCFVTNSIIFCLNFSFPPAGDLWCCLEQWDKPQYCTSKWALTGFKPVLARPEVLDPRSMHRVVFHGPNIGVEHGWKHFGMLNALYQAFFPRIMSATSLRTLSHDQPRLVNLRLAWALSRLTTRIDGNALLSMTILSSCLPCIILPASCSSAAPSASKTWGYMCTIHHPAKSKSSKPSLKS